jgi:hypothetical protein
MANSLFKINNIFNYTFIISIALSCNPGSSDYKKEANSAEIYRQSIKNLTDIIVYDIFSPPVASRIYAYPNIAAYEILRLEHPHYKSLKGQINSFQGIPLPDTSEIYCYPLAANHSFAVVGRALIFSEEKMNNYISQLHEKYQEIGVPNDVFKRSIKYAERVSKEILKWANEDNYKQTRTFTKYTVRPETMYWKPTPPDYMEGIEPHWNKIRTFVLDSANQFIPVKPKQFSMDTTSDFYKELVEVYDVGVGLSEEQIEIAKFWDCNPYVSHHAGHAMFATKKITPGGHWIGITDIATKKSNADLMETVNAFTRVSISLHDAFVSCWDEKWRSILVRPETLINEYIDDSWAPLLQTPPFPEYTSGHSVISTAAAITLTDIFGEQFQFMDSTEYEYGLPPREFNSFLEASQEAAISRLYGGIHYRMAIVNGVDQGRDVGNFIVKNLRTK